MATEPLTLQRPSWKNEYLALLCGIANAGGGVLTLTSPDDGSGKGIQKIRKSFESIPELTQESLGITCTTEPVMMGGVICLEISIPPAKEPVSYEGTYYLYEDGQNVAKPREEIDRAINAMQNVPWELRVQPDSLLDAAEPYMVARFAEGIGGTQASSMADGDTMGFDPDNEALLASARLKDARSRCLTNAGTLLLSRTPETFVPGAYVRIDLYDEDDYGILQQEEVTGTLLSQLESAVDLIFDRFIPLISKSGKMSTPPPFIAVSEAIRNALVHRDYTSASPVRVGIHPGHIAIENAGRPPATWSISDLMGRHMSRPHNPVIAAALQDVGEFNGWGNGVSAMSQACSAAGLPQPKITVGNDSTTVTFAFSGSSGSSEPSVATESGKTANLGATATEQTARYMRPVDSKNAPFKERSVAALNDIDLTSTDEYVLKVLIANGRATATAIAKFVGVSESTVRRSFRKLREYGLIERVGSDKAGYWKVLF